MFDESFIKLEIDEIAPIIDEINKKIDGSIFDPLETTILSIDVSFYPEYRFLSISDHATNPPLQRFVFQKKNSNDFTIIDWTYNTIYSLNKNVPIRLSDNNILEYVRFYFSYVKGRHGKFIICESINNIRWKDNPSEDEIKKINEIIKPLEIKEKNKDGTYKVEAFMMLKDALFSVNVFVNKNGKITMSDYEVLIENLSVIDSLF